MRTVISEMWKARVMDLITRAQPVDETTAYRPAIQWLIIELTRRNRVFKLHSLGSGVQRITTITDICPCCKKLI